MSDGGVVVCVDRSNANRPPCKASDGRLHSRSNSRTHPIQGAGVCAAVGTRSVAGAQEIKRPRFGAAADRDAKPFGFFLDLRAGRHSPRTCTTPRSALARGGLQQAAAQVLNARARSRDRSRQQGERLAGRAGTSWQEACGSVRIESIGCVAAVCCVGRPARARFNHRASDT